MRRVGRQSADGRPQILVVSGQVDERQQLGAVIAYFLRCSVPKAPPKKNEELINQFGSQQRIEELTRRGFAVVDDVSGRIESEDLMTDAASATRLKFVLVPEHVQSGQTASVIQLTFVLTDNQSDVID